MINSRLIQLLRTLNSRELTALEDFLASPAHTAHSYNLTFFQQLRKYAPAFDQPGLDKGRFLKKHANELDAKQLSYRLSELTELTEQFLQWQAYLADEWRQALDLYRIGGERQLPALRNKAQRRIERWLEQSPHRDATYYRRAYAWARLQHLQLTRPERDFQPHLQHAAHALDDWFAVEKLRYQWEMTNLEQMMADRYDHGLPVEAHERAPAVVEWYQQALLLQKDPSATETYFALRRQLMEADQLLPPSEVKALYTGLLNFCTRRLNQFADERFRREYFLLNQHLLDKGWLLEGGRLSPWRYLNLAAAALAVEEEDWVADFVEDYRSFLPPGMTDSPYGYARAQLLYQRGQLADAQRALAQVAFEEPFFNAAVRLLLIKILYDAGETELLFNQLEANRLFFLRDTAMDARRKAPLRNFNEWVRRLARLLPKDRKGAAQ
ncbi:MAG: hypothetical protein KDC54_13470, partial [Lewinella sp.]|nr:hypothetical protein [Lewinella sp.]